MRLHPKHLQQQADEIEAANITNNVPRNNALIRSIKLTINLYKDMADIMAAIEGDNVADLWGKVSSYPGLIDSAADHKVTMTGWSLHV